MFLKIVYSSIFIVFFGVFVLFIAKQDNISDLKKSNFTLNSKNKFHVTDLSSSGAKLFYSGAKKQIGIVKEYDFSNGYYSSGGFPPAGIGVCSDVIRISYKELGLDFKKIINSEIKKDSKYYNNELDSNINFRRVKVLWKYFEKNSKQKLTNDIIPKNKENLENWQTGDIVIFDKNSSGLWHIGLISDIRREDGVPYIIDNHGYGIDIRITPLDWPSKIIGHYRVF